MIGYLLRKIFYRKLTSELTEVKLNNWGFSIHEPFGATPVSCLWTDIKSIRFSESYTEVIIKTLKKTVVVPDHTIGFYEFIQNIPEEYTEFNHAYVEEFMASLSACKVCGIVAVNNGKCIVCDTIAWNDKMNQSEEDYLTLKQQEFYSRHIEEGIKIKDKAEPEHGFKADENWILYIDQR